MNEKKIRDEFVMCLVATGCSTKEIQTFLEGCNERLSLRQIQRLLKKNGKGRQQESPITCVQRAIEAELQGSGRLLGYRAMWYRLRNKYKLNVRRDTVMMLLAILDPHSTALRKKRKLVRRVYRSKGPNFAWHADGYDKLKPFGLPIHGCIDGYSRKIMWLKVASSNNNPRYIASFYCECVTKVGGCPSVLRTDLGTENSNIAVIQPVLRHYDCDSLAGEKSHRYGKNQRIESLWCQLRKFLSEWWISFFKDMEDQGHFNSLLPYHTDAVRYAFGPLIQKELDEFTWEWNHHRIRRSNMSEVPHGIPDVLYSVPSLNGSQDYIHAVNHQMLSSIRDEFCEEPSLVCPEFRHLAEAILNLNSPTTFLQALEVYFVLIVTIENTI